MRWYPIVFALLFSVLAQGQNQFWKGYFSHAEIADVASGDQGVYAASESTVFGYDIRSTNVQVWSTIEGLKAQKITALYYSSKFKKLFVGNQDGSLQIVNRSNGKISNLNDILNKPSLPPTAKRINSFLESGSNLYIATNYGISVLDLNNNEFGDTYFIGDAGEAIPVLQTAVVGSWIYAALGQSGIKRALLNNAHLVDFQQWENFDYGNWLGIANLDGTLVAAKSDQQLYRFAGSTPTAFFELKQPFQNLKVSDNQLVVTTAHAALVFRSPSVPVLEIPLSQSGLFTASTAVAGSVYVGTAGSGLLQFNPAQTSNPNVLSPAGPLSNKVFSLLNTPEGLWMIFGGYNKEYNPHNPGLGAYGMSFLSKSRTWAAMPFWSLQQAYVLSFAAVNPKKPGHLYVSSFHSGWLDITLNPGNLAQSELKLFNASNTGSQGLQALDPAAHPGTPADYVSVRVNGTAFDAEGNAWMTNSVVRNSIKMVKPNGEWSAFSLADRLPNVDQLSLGPPLIDRNGTKWMGTNRQGLVGFNEKKANKTVVLGTGSNAGDLPDANVRTLALDHNNQLWIGTFAGLRVISNVDRFLSEAQFNASSIVIKQDGLASELFYQQDITKIKVDGANDKWVAVANAGVFLVSANGQEVKQRFTKENSPLPNNTINDIEIDANTGEVFFATDSGMVSFRGGATQAKESLDGVFVYPNPVRPEFAGDVKISGLVDQANVKIADVAGNLVFEATAIGGTVSWDTRSFAKQRVASGVYLVLVSSKDGADKTAKKLLIIR